MEIPNLLLLLRTLLLAAMAGVCLYSDLKYRLIWNKVTYSFLLAGLLFSIVEAGLLRQGSATGLWWLPMVQSVGGALFGFFVMFLLFIAGGVGGGDVKLMAAGGAIVGFPYIIYTLLYASLFGVALGLAVLIWRGRGTSLFRALFDFGSLLKRKGPEESIQPVPFGVAFAGGCVWALVMTYF